jgi:hypothetical protein
MMAPFTVWIVEWPVAAQRKEEHDERMDGRRDVALDSDRRTVGDPPGCRD